MYFFLTNHCKMKCAHCGVNASPKGKNYMSQQIFLEGLKLAEKLGTGVFLGGGEPTDHPKFIYFLMEMLSADIELESSGVITNGTNKKEARLISHLSDVIYTGISLDSFHDATMVSEEVKKLKFSCVRKATNIIPIGRAKKLSFAKNTACICPELFLNWDGDLYSCGCKKEFFGNILNKISIPFWRSINSCYKERELEKAEKR
jgi:MoaA/NifB/PqqE/SkfB family radical SAM enzyme